MNAPAPKPKSLPIGTTGLDFEGYRIVRHHGVVRGVIVRAPTIVQGLFGGLKAIIGGRINSYIKMCEQTRQNAYQEMLEQAARLGANAVIGIRYDAAAVAKNAHEVLCYGTAVSIEKKAPEAPQV